MITRREAIKAVALTAGALTVVPSFLQGQTSDSSTGGSTYPFKLAPLGYPYDALEPYIDALTMQIHHDKHNGAYVDNLNKAIAQAPESIQKMSLEELLLNLDKVPDNIRTAVRNNAGGQYNHSFFWKLLKKNEGGKPTGELATAIDGTFGSYSAFQDKLSEAAVKVFGSGWAWLVADGKQLDNYDDTKSGLSYLETAEERNSNRRYRRMGTRLLPQIPEPSCRIRKSILERDKLGLCR